MMQKKLGKKSRFIVFVLFAFLFSCNEGKQIQDYTNIESKDSLVIYDDGIFLYINKKEPILKEGIFFLKDGNIDYDKSIFVEERGNDLYYHSPYYKYQVGKKRFIVFKGNNNIKKDFENVSNLKLVELNFDKDAKINNYKNVIPKIGIIEETIFLDTIIGSNSSKSKKNKNNYFLYRL